MNDICVRGAKDEKRDRIRVYHRRSGLSTYTCALLHTCEHSTRYNSKHRLFAPIDPLSRAEFVIFVRRWVLELLTLWVGSLYVCNLLKVCM